MTQIYGGSTFRDDSAQGQAFTHSCTPRGHAFVAFPGAPYTHDCAVQSARSVLGSQGWSVHARDSDETLTEEGVSEWIASTVAASTPPAPTPTLRLMDYDLIDFDSIHPSKSATASTTALSSSYPIRKALIRKNWLYNSIHAHSVKSSRDTLRHLPRTWNIDVQFADDLDELLIDELYDLNEILQNNEAGGDPTTRRWFILKAGMADRGMGIRMFDTLDGLRGILEEFEDDSDDEEDDVEEQEEDGDGDAAHGAEGTAVSLSQLRHFVIQEYLHPPLLISPPAPHPRTFRKFHLRAYVLCVGGLQVYLYNEMLALFAPSAYTAPTADSHDARVHLTNTCLHSDGSTTANGNIPDENVHLLSDLCRDDAAVGGQDERRTLSLDDYTSLLALCKETIGETFEAAAKGSGSTNWMMWGNCFEVFGVDLLVSAAAAAAQGDDDEWKVSLLEVNAQPDFAQSGKRLQGVVRELFDKTLQVAVLRQQGVDGFTLCFDEQLRGGW